MNTQTVRCQQDQSGFSLIEIMVSVVISMIAMVVVLQIFSSSEAKKRATTGGNDAQMGGVLALAGLQRDVRQAGYGMTTMSLLGCNIQLRSGVTLNGLAPVTINHASIPAGDPNTDTLLISYGVSNGAPEGDVINAQPTGSQTYAMSTPTAFSLKDWVIAEPPNRPSPCNLLLDQVTSQAASGGSTITVQTGSSGMSFGTLYNLGHDVSNPARGPQFLAYAVRKGSLTVCDYMANDCGDSSQTGNANVWAPVAANIASLRAQYGRDTTSVMDGVVDIYDQTTPSAANSTYACDIARISAVRLALVARSAEYDKNAPTTVTPTWEASTANNPAGSAAAPIDLSGNTGLPTGMTWHNYRYKVFQTVVPIRVTTWLGPQQGC